MNDLEATEQSTLNLYARFGLAPTQQAAIAKFAEESYEFIDALRTGDDAHVLEEAGDVIVTVIGALSVRGLTAHDLIAALTYVRKKNDAKTHDTHVVHEGTITRRSKLNGLHQLDFDDLEANE